MTISLPSKATIKKQNRTNCRRRPPQYAPPLSSLCGRRPTDRACRVQTGT